MVSGTQINLWPHHNLGHNRADYAPAPIRRNAAESGIRETVATSPALPFEQTSPEIERTTGVFKECLQCGTCFDSDSGKCALDGVALAPVLFSRTLAGRYLLESLRMDCANPALDLLAFECRQMSINCHCFFYRCSIIPDYHRMSDLLKFRFRGWCIR